MSARTGWPTKIPRQQVRPRLVDTPLQDTWLYRVGSAEKRAEMEAQQVGQRKRRTK